MLVLLALWAGACTMRAPEPATPAPEHVAFPAHEYRSPGPGESVYQLQPGSRAVILVRREGALARFGHDHAIVARPIEGRILWVPAQPASSRADLQINVLDLEVDPAAERLAHALDTRPDAGDVESTRNNLFEHVLLATAWPRVQLRLYWLDGELPEVRLGAELTINGNTSRTEVPARLLFEGDGLNASGRFMLRQSDWGIEPFSVLGGGLRVADTVEIHFDLAALRESFSPAP
jgi:hypothetical protein